MKKRKYPKLPNRYGSIKKLSGSRRNPYAVYPPSQGVTLNGSPILPPAICYTDSWYKGFAILTAYHAGTYKPGMELGLPEPEAQPKTMDKLIAQVMADYSRMLRSAEPSSGGKTYSEVYKEFYAWKFSNPKKPLSVSTQTCYKTAYRYSSKLYDKLLRDITYDDLQATIDECQKRHATKEHILIVQKQIFKFGIMKGYIDSDPSKYIAVREEDDDIHGVPFSSEELSVLWKNRQDPRVEVALIMCYSGHRISELEVIDVDLDSMVFRGGLKTKAGKARVVPIHSAIQPIVQRRINAYGKLLFSKPEAHRTQMKSFFKDHGMDHTPHDCRHTFSALCEHYGVQENDRKRMLGHAIGDITNDIYGHRTGEELREQIEKIQVPFCH